MQRRIVVLLGLLGALAGIFLLFWLLHQDPPDFSVPEISEPPRSVAPPPADGLEAVRHSGTLEGKVLNGDDRRPIEGATVIALAPDLAPAKPGEEIPLWGELLEKGRVVTGRDGTFSIEDLSPDYYNLWVEKIGYGWNAVPRIDFKKTHVIELFPACSVTGRVVYDDDRPAPGVRIWYTPQGTLSEVFSRYRKDAYFTRTGPDGTFLYTGLPHGKFTVEVLPEEHLPAPWDREKPLEPGENRDLGIRKLDAGFGMKVWVKWRGTSEPVEGIKVTVRPVGDPMPRTWHGRKRRTNANGLAAFGGLGGQVMEKPTFLVAAEVPGVGPVMPDEGRLFRPDEEVTIYLRKTSVIKGKVQRPNGKPLEVFWVMLQPKRFITRQLQGRGENGEFILYQIPEGTYDLSVRYGNLVDKTIEVTAVGGQETDIGTVVLEEGAEIYGTVRRSSGKELEGIVRVHLARKVRNERLQRDDWTTVARAYCRKDGTYRLKGIPEGRFFLWPAPDQGVSHKTDPLPVEIGPGTGALQRDLVLHGVGYVKLEHWGLEDGQLRRVPMPPTYLVKRGDGAETRWLGDGTRLRGGRYDIYVELENEDGVPQRYRAAEVNIQEGETTGPIELRLFEIRNGG